MDTCVDYLLDWIAPVVKYVMHIITGQSEIERICNMNDGRHTDQMTIRFSQSLKKSKQLKDESKIVFTCQPFSIDTMEKKIVSVKKMERCRPVVIANIRNSLKSLRLITVVSIKLSDLRKIKFSYDNSDHLKLLEQLWTQLKPNIRRSTTTLICSDWAELGFQGKDPSSDFRGMGLLGLLQVVHFSQHFNHDAIALLHQSQLDHQYFPFAATGINMTAFVVDLLANTNLHRLLISHMDRILLQDTIDSMEGCSEDEKCIHFTIAVLHDFYSRIYISFGKLWVESKPKDLMEFPRIFDIFKKQIRTEYPPL
jgi:hypothetical protein